MARKLPGWSRTEPDLLVWDADPRITIVRNTTADGEVTYNDHPTFAAALAEAQLLIQSSRIVTKRFTQSEKAESATEYVNRLVRRVKSKKKAAERDEDPQGRISHKMVRGGREYLGKPSGLRVPVTLSASSHRRLRGLNPEFGARTQATGTRAWVRARKEKCVNLTRQAIESIRQSQPDSAFGFRVPNSVGPLIEAGMPPKVANVLVKRARNVLFGDTGIEAARTDVFSLLGLLQQTSGYAVGISRSSNDVIIVTLNDVNARHKNESVGFLKNVKVGGKVLELPSEGIPVPVDSDGIDIIVAQLLNAVKEGKKLYEVYRNKLDELVSLARDEMVIIKESRKGVEVRAPLEKVEKGEYVLIPDTKKYFAWVRVEAVAAGIPYYKNNLNRIVPVPLTKSGDLVPPQPYIRWTLREITQELFNRMEKTARDTQASASRSIVVTFTFQYKRLKPNSNKYDLGVKQYDVELPLAGPNLQHSKATPKGDESTSSRYRTLAGVTLDSLPGVLCRLAQRGTKKGRELDPFQPTSQSSARENPMIRKRLKAKGRSRRRVLPATKLSYSKVAGLTRKQLKRLKTKAAREELARRSRKSRSSSRTRRKSSVRRASPRRRVSGRKTVRRSAVTGRFVSSRSKSPARRKTTRRRTARRNVSALQNGLALTNGRRRKAGRKTRVSARRAPARRASSGRKVLSAWQRFLKKHAGRGLTVKRMASMYRSAGKSVRKSGTRKAVRGKSKSRRSRARRNSSDLELDNPGSFLASDPWHPVYEQVLGQFGASEKLLHGLQPVNRRNRGKKKR
jgi:hypothetical protein